jgi:HPt (histidine-containing phosphotransfer) domain-containing protein/HAMP domain-containing protein
MKATSSSSDRRVFVSIGTRLTVPVVLLVAAVAVGAYFGLARTSRVTAMRSKEVAVDMVAKLTALSAMPAVVFADEVEMRRAVDDLAKNPEVTDVELWAVPSDSAPGDTPLASFHRQGGRAIGRPSAFVRSRGLEPESVLASEPIDGPDGKTVALLAIRLSTAREAAALSALTRQILYSSLLTGTGLAVALLLVMRRTVVLPLGRLQKAARGLTQGGKVDPAESLARDGGTEDEVVQLAAAFGEMAEAVRDREQRLAIRNTELRLILDSVHQGFLTALRDGALLPERSKIIESWLGDLPLAASVFDVVGRIDPSARSWFEAAWSQVIDGIFPLDCAVEQLPKRLVRDGRHFEFVYHPVMKGEEIDRMVIVLTDVTAEVERQRALAEQQEFSVLVDQFVRDRRAFYDFWGEASELVRRVVDSVEASDGVRRDLHTLKGNARFFGLNRLAGLCHETEDAMRERGENLLSASERKSLQELWDALRRRIEPLIHGSTAFVEISKEEYERLVDAIRRRQPLETLEELVRGLRHEPTAWRLGRAKETLAMLAQKLGKTPPEVVIQHNDLRLSTSRFAPFWSVFGHLMNNAIDHGVERDDERKAAGKPLPAKIRLSTQISAGELVVEAEDDGRGIDWDRVARLARERGLSAKTQRDLVRCLLSDGFTLKSEVSDVSGRGVGLSAVNSVVTAFGGRIELESTLGVGTIFRFRLPIGKLDDEAQQINPPQAEQTRLAAGATNR